MYNRYIPQPDGSYRRNRVPDNIPQPQKPKAPPPSPPCPPVADTPSPELCSPPPPPAPKRKHRHPPEHKPQPCNGTDSISGFFRNLIPKDLDTGDLLIILLLLLMCGDREEDRNNALLTLALYFFL